MTIILGGVVIEAKFRDGSTDEVKVRQLPIECMSEFAILEADQAGLVELYCDRQDKLTPQRLAVLRTQELSLLDLLGKADPEQFEGLDARLVCLREKIDDAEKITRWDSKLLPESHDEILRIGEALNRPTFDRWLEGTTTAIGHMKETTAKFRLANSSPSAPSSSEPPIP